MWSISRKNRRCKQLITRSCDHAKKFIISVLSVKNSFVTQDLHIELAWQPTETLSWVCNLRNQRKMLEMFICKSIFFIVILRDLVCAYLVGFILYVFVVRSSGVQQLNSAEVL